MRTKTFLSVVGIFVALASVAHAGITNVIYAPVGGNWSGWSTLSYDQPSSTATMGMYGDQAGPAIGSGTIFASSAEDPTLAIGGTVDNDTAFSWGGYRIRVYMDRVFTLTDVVVGPNPSDWTFSITPPAPNGSPSYYGINEYVAQIDYTGGTPVAPGGEFDFSYKLNFTGSLTYSFTQEMTPLEAIPEPTIISLGALGLLGLVGANRRRALAA